MRETVVNYLVSWLLRATTSLEVTDTEYGNIRRDRPPQWEHVSDGLYWEVHLESEYKVQERD